MTRDTFILASRIFPSIHEEEEEDGEGEEEERMWISGIIISERNDMIRCMIEAGVGFNSSIEQGAGTGK